MRELEKLQKKMIERAHNVIEKQDEEIVNLKEYVQELERRLKVNELQKVSAPDTWPQEGDEVWYWDTIANIPARRIFEIDNPVVRNLAPIGELFRTEAECKYNHEHRKLIKDMQDFSGFVPDWSDWDQRKYYLYYNYENRKWETSYCTSSDNGRPVYFQNPIQIEAFIVRVGRDRLCYYFPQPSAEVLEKLENG